MQRPHHTNAAFVSQFPHNRREIAVHVVEVNYVGLEVVKHSFKA